jgi:hypothetical protein
MFRGEKHADLAELVQIISVYVGGGLRVHLIDEVRSGR